MARGVDARVLHQPEDLTPLVRQRQRHDRARTPRTRRTARPVQVVLVVTGRIHVQHEVDAVDVNTPRRHIGRDEHIDVAVLEVGQRPRPRALRHTAVQRVRLHTGVTQLLRDPVGTQLGPHEDDRPPLAGGDRGRHRRLVLRLHDQDVVRHGRHRALRRVHLVQNRVLQVPVDEGLDLVLHGRGEQHPLAARRNLVQQLGDLGQEAQVGHLVGLVEHRDLDVLQGAGAAVDDVAETAGGRHEHIHAALQGVDLVPHGRTAADDLHLQAELVAVRLQRVRDLHRELTGRGEDDRTRPVLLGTAAGEAGQRRQTERQRLAGAGTATAQDVLARQRVRDGRGLDREGDRHAVLRELAHDALGETEVPEGGLGSGVLDGRVLRVLGHDDVISTGNGHAYAKPSGVSSARARQLRDSQYDRLNAVSHGKGEYAPHGALCSGAGQMGSNDLPPYAPPAPQRKPTATPVGNVTCIGKTTPPGRRPPITAPDTVTPSRRRPRGRRRLPLSELRTRLLMRRRRRLRLRRSRRGGRRLRRRRRLRVRRPRGRRLSRTRRLRLLTLPRPLRPARRRSRRTHLRRRRSRSSRRLPRPALPLVLALALLTDPLAVIRPRPLPRPRPRHG
ncbi:putative ATP-dependent RNA helicase [Streptomyces viridochromogenes Tue57]|uniref:Putative ATP-dependent RNA helicase n=1 Tax=Streptomyces viridochromogenes Tue57 TaxID=1160705 RepID=L8PDZ1_STRVR|nr:putative ATP-dependent RNA helicase [Streptomyces viridochromogenes Tue57]